EPAQDLPDQAAADAVGLDQDQGAFGGGSVSHAPTLSAAAAPSSRSRRSRSIRPPSRIATIHRTTKIPPTRNIIGTTSPAARTAPCSTEPTTYPPGRRSTPAVRTS